MSKTGLETHWSPVKIEALGHENLVDISAGNRHSLFLTTNSRVYACGDAKSG